MDIDILNIYLTRMWKGKMDASGYSQGRRIIRKCPKEDLKSSARRQVYSEIKERTL